MNLFSKSLIGRFPTASTCLAALVLAISPAARPGAEEIGGEAGPADVAKAFSGLKENWRDGKISQVVITHVPTEARYPLALSSSRLDAQATFQFIVRNPKEHEITQELLKRIEKTGARVSAKRPDLRWSFAFLTDTGEQVFGIYLDDKGRNGIINGVGVSFDSDGLFLWAEAVFASVFK